VGGDVEVAVGHVVGLVRTRRHRVLESIADGQPFDYDVVVGSKSAKQGPAPRPCDEVSHRVDDVAADDHAVGAGRREVVEHAEEVVGLGCGSRSDRRGHAHADLIELDERHTVSALGELLEQLEARG